MLDDFVRPETARLPLTGGHFVDVKKRLNHGETEDMYSRWQPFVTPGAPLRFRRDEVRTAKVAAYLVAWSLTANGQPVPIGPALAEADRFATIRSLDPDRFTEIHDAIERHELVVQRERDEQKKMLDGPPAAGATSPSQSEPDGA